MQSARGVEDELAQLLSVRVALPVLDGSKTPAPHATAPEECPTGVTKSAMNL